MIHVWNGWASPQWAGSAFLAQTLGSFVALGSEEMRTEADGHGNGCSD